LKDNDLSAHICEISVIFFLKFADFHKCYDVKGEK
jgi:hypothetical protein